MQDGRLNDTIMTWHARSVSHRDASFLVRPDSLKAAAFLSKSIPAAVTFQAS